MNAFVYRALADATFLGGQIGEESQAEKFRKDSDDLAAAFNRVLWVEKEGTYYAGYFDGANPESAKRRPELKIDNNLVEPTS